MCPEMISRLATPVRPKSVHHGICQSTSYFLFALVFGSVLSQNVHSNSRRATWNDLCSAAVRLNVALTLMKLDAIGQGKF